MVDYKKIIHDKRESLGISQRQLAKTVGITQAFMNEIESGRKKPSIDVLFRICEALEIPVFPEE